MARGEETPASDVDLLADFDQTLPLSRMRLGKIEYQLDDLLDAKVDLFSAEWMYPRIRTRAIVEGIVAF